MFLYHNHLKERWLALGDRDLFTVAETGFGTSLNFLCTWQYWREIASPKTKLHFVSTEKYPLSYAELTQTLALWPNLASLADQLLAQYHLPSPMSFDEGRVVLTLLLGDARETLTQLHDKVDAWFLDGFAPAKNPELWQPSLFQTIAGLSAPDATFATYTCAGAVRRGLEAAGFQVEKVPGFGCKREMLRGSLKR